MMKHTFEPTFFIEAPTRAEGFQRLLRLLEPIGGPGVEWAADADEPPLRGRPEHDSGVLEPAPGLVKVRIHPQAWVDDIAVAADAEGPTVFYVPEDEAKDAAGAWLRPDTHESDDLARHENAPAWVRNWHGPFCIELLHQDAEGEQK